LPAAVLAAMNSVVGNSVVGPGVSLAGRYRLDEPLGSGGAGHVWRAVDLVLKRQVAVKLLRADAVGDPEARARFRAEARNASRMSHPCVAQVYDYCEDGSPDVPFLVMELVDGPSLAELLAAGPPGVLAELRRLDLRPRLAWVPTSAQAPGTVLSVQPGGALPPDTLVTVTIAAQPALQSDPGNGGGGAGDGDGGGDRGGGDNGGSDGGGNGG
jgi:uncharacterized membrane protein YgcG